MVIHNCVAVAYRCINNSIDVKVAIRTSGALYLETIDEATVRELIDDTILNLFVWDDNHFCGFKDEALPLNNNGNWYPIDAPITAVSRIIDSNGSLMGYELLWFDETSPRFVTIENMGKLTADNINNLSILDDLHTVVHKPNINCKVLNNDSTIVLNNRKYRLISDFTPYIELWWEAEVVDPNCLTDDWVESEIYGITVESINNAFEFNHSIVNIRFKNNNGLLVDTLNLSHKTKCIDLSDLDLSAGGNILKEGYDWVEVQIVVFNKSHYYNVYRDYVGMRSEEYERVVQEVSRADIPSCVSKLQMLNTKAFLLV